MALDKQIKAETVDLSIGGQVFHGNSRYVITASIDLSTVAARSTSSGNTVRLKISELSKYPKGEENSEIEVIPKKELLSIGNAEWEKAHNKALMYSEILSLSQDKRRDQLKLVAKKLGIAEVSAYKQLQKFKEINSPQAFLRKKRHDKNIGRLQTDIEELIQEAIDQFFLTTQKIKITNLYDKLYELKNKKEQEYKDKGINKKLNLPHINTVRNRIANLTASQKAAKRHGKKGVEDYRPIIGQFPEVAKPLEVVQIDHTPLDIIIVDDEHRQPIGRPTLTLAIDIYSRMVTGFYLSFEKPSSLLVGCCLTHSILDKDAWMIEHNITGEWPVYGLMDTIHTDNGKEFHGNTFKKACELHGINIDWRPVRTPRYGGHVERLFRTINDELHKLPGTTFSNVQHKGEYDSTKLSSLTLKEMETWLTEFFVNVYHKKEHSSIGMPPIDKYKQGILGTDSILGCGLPPKITDSKALKIDFLPYQERSVQRYGIKLHGIHYFHDVLRKWIRQPDKKKKGTRKFIVRYDPRDLSCVFFYDPDLEAYLTIPYRNSSRPTISFWELRAIKSKLANEQSSIDEEVIFQAKERMNQLVDSAVKHTKLMRKNKQKESIRRTESIPSQVQSISLQVNSTDEQNLDEELNFDDISPFDDTEE